MIITRKAGVRHPEAAPEERAKHMAMVVYLAALELLEKRPEREARKIALAAMDMLMLEAGLLGSSSQPTPEPARPRRRAKGSNVLAFSTSSKASRAKAEATR